MRYFVWIATLLLVSASSALAGELTLTTEKDQYWRYELVKVIVSPGTTPTARVKSLPDKLSATIWKGKTRITTVGSLKKIVLKKQASGQWEGLWPIPFNPTLGTYTAKVAVFDGKSTTLTAHGQFKIRGRKPYELPKGFSVVTYEGGKYGPNKTPSMEPGGKRSWRNLISWTKYMGADAFWQCVGQTQIWGKRKDDLFPFSKYTVRLMKRAAKESHEAGMQYGAWVTSFVVIGNKIEDSGYSFTLGYSREKNALRQLRYVSLGCQERIIHIIELLKKFEADPNVDYIGLDYMRTDFGGYEFADEFVRDMDITTPVQWSKWSSSERSLWLARLIQVRRVKAAREQWMWWRAHKVALVIEHIMAEVKPTKPVWVFSLGWRGGHQHGQDLLMMLDAGIGFNAPMFYEIEKPDLPHMLYDWKKYLRKADASLVFGQPVDWNLLQRTKDPAGTWEHLDRQVLTIKELYPLTKTFGLFWHDLARAFFGARGPYGSKEWIMCGAASFTRLKAKAKRYSYKVEIEAPLELILHRDTELKLKITNLSANSTTAVSAELVDMPRLIRLDEKPKVLDNLGPHNNTQTVSLCLRTDSIYNKNGGQQMVAIKVTSPADGDNPPWFDFVYLPVTKQLGPPLPSSNTSTANGSLGNTRTGKSEGARKK
ncbi:hypothetical protein KAR34_02930 [bacterium]|nr:hypothetical protein [bacterium]